MLDTAKAAQEALQRGTPLAAASVDLRKTHDLGVEPRFDEMPWEASVIDDSCWEAIAVSVERERRAKVPPRWFVRTAWVVHRGIYRFSGGRLGLATPKPQGRYGLLRLTTVGRRSGEERVAILGYYEDGPNLVTLAMNGWADGEPAWWLNLQAHPEASVDLKDGPRTVRARAAEGEERARLWARMRDHAGGEDLDAYAALRSSETAVVVLEPRLGSGA